MVMQKSSNSHGMVLALVMPSIIAVFRNLRLQPRHLPEQVSPNINELQVGQCKLLRSNLQSFGIVNFCFSSMFFRVSYPVFAGNDRSTANSRS